MYFFCKYIVIATVLFTIFKGSVTLSTKEYLEYKLKETKELLTKAYIQARVSTADDKNAVYEKNLVKLWSETWSMDEARMINFLNQIFIIDGEKLFSININAVATHNIYIINRLNFSSSQEPIKFIKNFSWNGSLFLLVCHTRACTHYQGTDITNLENRQIIENIDLLPIDACFFTRENQLYLIISYSTVDHSISTVVPSKIYRLKERYMNYIEEILTPAVTAVATIPDELSTIVLFALDHNEKYGLDAKIGCLLYKLQDENSAELITFLNTNSPVKSTFSYNYNEEEFIFLIDDESSSGIFWWDGTALKRWINMPELKSSNLRNIVHINNETLLFVCNSDTLHIYKISNHIYIHLNNLNVECKQHVVEIAVLEKENSLMLILMKKNHNNTYLVELWELHLQQQEFENAQSKEVWMCFQHLHDLINSRNNIIEDLRSTWIKSVPIPENVTSDIPIQMPKLYNTDEENIPYLNLKNQEEYEVSTPLEIKAELKKVERYVDTISTKIKNIDVDDKITVLSGKVVIEGDAYFQEFYTDNLNVEFFNDQKVEMDKILISQIDQNFSVPLQGKNIFIDNLEIPSLCKLKSDNWLRVNDTERTNILEIDLNSSSIYNDTIVINNGITLKELYTENIDGVNIKNFLNDIFIEGEKQIIKGNITYQNLVQIVKLTSNQINNHSSKELLTRYTNQTLSDFFIDTLEVHHLFVERINGVPVDKAARISQENIIKGKVILSNLIITDELIVNENVAFPLTRPTQVYNEVVINGNIFLKNLEMEAETSLIIGDGISNAYNIQNILENSWSKSRNQIIKNSITFKKGASIDQLYCQYLNNLSEQDFLYVDSYELNDLENITFTNFHFDKVINNSTGIVQRFIEESANLLTFHKTIRISHLSVDNIFTDSYNGIAVDFIMQPNDTLKFFGVTDFDIVRIDDQMIIDDLQMNYLNLKNTNIFKKALKLDQNIHINKLKTSEIFVKNLNIKKLCDQDLEEVLLAQENISNQSKISITIDGELDIENNIQVDTINDKSSSNYIEMLKNINPVDLIETENIKNVHIMKNLNVKFLNGHNINDIFARALSKTNKQTLSGEFIVLDANVKYLTTEIINKKNVSNLMYIDEPCIFYGNISFSELFVKGNIFTKTLNNKNVTQIQKELHVIPMKTLTSLHVFGNIFWNKPSLNLHSINYLLSNAITKHEDQIINCSVTFQEPVVIDYLYLKTEDLSVVNKIQEIISDTVTDNSHDSILIKGTKIFKKRLVINDLEVTNNIDINNVNDHNFPRITSQIFRKYYNDTVENQITFLGKVEIEKLITKSKIHGIPLYELATYNKTMPKKLHFKHLIIRKNITLYKLDGVIMDDFKRRRITIDEDHEIFGDVQFNAPVTVLNESFVSLINGIKPINFVVNNSSQTPTFIYGNKTFMSKLNVEGDVETVKINDFDIETLYNNSCLNNENVEIFGDLIFENNVETLGNINVSGQLNELEISTVLKPEELSKIMPPKYLKKEELLIKNLISSWSNLSSKFSSEVLYLEKDIKLNIHLPGVLSMRSTQIKLNTRLDIHAIESPIFCGLENNCTCKRQYTVKISPSGNYEIQKPTSFNVVFNFYDPNRFDGLSVISEAVSSNEHCSRKSNETEITKIFWMKFNNYIETEIQTEALQIEGFVADAQRFVIDDRLYLILAIFYDKTIKSHAIKSLVYEFNLKTKSVKFLQSISTDGAKTLHIFHITNVGVHVLIGCVKGKAESLLLRFDLVTQQFHLLQTFATGGSKHITSVSRNNNSFIILNNPDIQALQIFDYDSISDYFKEYQNIYFESRVTSLNVFYAGDFGDSEAFVITTTKDGWFYLYEYMFFGKFQLKISHWLEDIQLLSPFHFMNENYLFAGSRLNSTVFKVIQSGIH